VRIDELDDETFDQWSARVFGWQFGSDTKPGSAGRSTARDVVCIPRGAPRAGDTDGSDPIIV